MTRLVLAGGLGGLIYNDSDDRTDLYYRPWVDILPYELGDFASPFWPRGGGLVGDPGASNLDTVEWGPRYLAGGATAFLGFPGVTRDAYGSPLGGVTVMLFQTSTRAYVTEVVSDAAGNFIVPVVFSDTACFLVYYKAGSPDVFGTSLNNLTPI